MCEGEAGGILKALRGRENPILHLGPWESRLSLWLAALAPGPRCAQAGSVLPRLRGVLTGT